MKLNYDIKREGPEQPDITHADNDCCQYEHPVPVSIPKHQFRIALTFFIWDHFNFYDIIISWTILTEELNFYIAGPMAMLLYKG